MLTKAAMVVGLVRRVCPVNNIIITDKKPIWQHHCENCLACYNWCPVKAIRGGIAAKNYYYRRPEIKIAEMIDTSIRSYKPKRSKKKIGYYHL